MSIAMKRSRRTPGTPAGSSQACAGWSAKLLEQINIRILANLLHGAAYVMHGALRNLRIHRIEFHACVVEQAPGHAIRQPFHESAHALITAVLEGGIRFVLEVDAVPAHAHEDAARGHLQWG